MLSHFEYKKAAEETKGTDPKLYHKKLGWLAGREIGPFLSLPLFFQKASMNKLTPQQRKALIQKHRLERDPRVRDRIKAVLAYDNGYSYSEIGRLLLLDDEMIHRHIKEFPEQEKLTIESGGSEPKLTPDQTEELIAHLDEKVYLYVKDICQYVKKKYGVNYSISGMTSWLHAHGFCYKKPQSVPGKLDKEKQAAFIKCYKGLKTRAANKEPIYFGDSVHLEHQTRLSYGWIRCGQRKRLPTTGRQKRVHIMGAISLQEQHVEYKEYEYLPPYSPNLNPIERLRVMHEKVIYNCYYQSFFNFAKNIKSFLKNLFRYKSTLRKRINDNFQIIETPNFAF